MRQRPLSRSLIALAAAYLVALQALILPLSLPAAAAAAVAGSLCVTSHDRSAPQPAGQDHGCPCAAGCGMACHAPALGFAAAASAVPAQPFIVVVLAPSRAAQSPGPALRGRPMPRGPPAA